MAMTTELSCCLLKAEKIKPFRGRHRLPLPAHQHGAGKLLCYCVFDVYVESFISTIKAAFFHGKQAFIQ